MTRVLLFLCRLLSCLTLIGLGGLYYIPQPTLGQTLTGLTITPPLQQIQLSPDQQSYQSTVAITNNQDQPVNLRFTSLDFGDLEQGGGLAFLGTTPDTLWDKHRLAAWLTISPQTVTIGPHDQQTITYTITNNQDLSPGGHYAAIITNTDDPNHDIAIKPSLSSLLFVTKEGGAVYDVEVKDMAARSAWWGTVQGAQLQLTNNGNTHVTPRGQLQLKDPTGTVIAQAIINDQSSLLMPQQSQTYQAALTSLKPAWWPGFYSLVLSYRYDGTDQIITQRTTVFSVGLASVAALGLAATAIVAVSIAKVVTSKSD